MAMRSSNDDSRPIRSLLRRLIKAPAALAVVSPALLILGSYVLWHQWGSEHISSNFSRVELSDIRITAPPNYVRSDVVKTVYHDTAMENLSLLERTATAKIASAFSLHPWVRNVHSVRKLPGGVIDIRLSYREPVAMARVYVPGEPAHVRDYLPVDGDGVLLPTEDFSRSETDKFIRIEAPGANTNNWSGARFGDNRVEAAARLAEVLAPYREQANIKEIHVSGDPRVDIVPSLALVTHDQLSFHWGFPPGMEPPGEATAQTKLEMLLQGNLESGTDLRVANRALIDNR